MKTLIVSNFRTGSWFVHDSFMKEGYMPLGEISNNTNNDRESKIKKFKERSKVVGILHPTQMKQSVRSCLRICEIADNIIYVQREDTREQSISYAVALAQTDSVDTSPWLRHRKTYQNEILDTDLNEAFAKLDVNNKMIQEIYAKFPSNVITLEKDLPYDPYPNKYNYKGDWQPPYSLKMI
jgi:hypothetical protein|tara:strand:+ start:99 stop:641 length:543 start_codon:yes stop_codon:yes gene_type:complete